ncbi:cytidine deaminase [Thermoflavifilum aggregans]|uniref:Cytidine deaminase n=1 Tax=Thermoflavifilum aggregans TaxID=454188 RepID=A0A2M9CUL2_9BACT|nr:cytidine deaminase [Thermoflavifilum aggregans]PJJ75498.1 cytidine deaminase [Thermoflavifilum aggregans]
MSVQHLQLQYEHFAGDAGLPAEAYMLLQKAREATGIAYAPYSQFRVGAAILVENGQVITGANQENASFPAGLCAERVALSAVSSQFPDAIIKAMAISYQPAGANSDHPISPCGICRQTMLEYEIRQQQPIRIILGGMTGEIIIIPAAQLLLPFSFTPQDLKGFPQADHHKHQNG